LCFARIQILKIAKFAIGTGTNSIRFIFAILYSEKRIMEARRLLCMLIAYGANNFSR